MEIFGIGPFELLLILMLALLVLGPQDMVKTAYRMGRAVNRFVRSPYWRTMLSMSMQARDLPKRIMRETALEDSINEIRNIGKQTTQELTQATGALTQEVNALRQDMSTPLQVADEPADMEEVIFSAEIAPDLSVFALLPEFPQLPLPPPTPPALPANLPAFNLQPTYRRD